MDNFLSIINVVLLFPPVWCPIFCSTFSLGAAFVHQIHLNKMSYTTESGVNLVKSKSGSIIVKNIVTCTYMIYEFVR